jgi:hypothetical protein
MRKFLVLMMTAFAFNTMPGCLPYATASGELGHKFNMLSFQTVMGWWNTYRFVAHDDGLTIETRGDDAPIFDQRQCEVGKGDVLVKLVAGIDDVIAVVGAADVVVQGHAGVHALA